LASYGYTDEYVVDEYRPIRAGQTLKAAGISDDDTMTVGEYDRLEEKRKRQEFFNDQQTEERRAFLEQKGVCPTDFERLITRFNDDSILSVTDDELIEAIMQEYGSSLICLGEEYYKKYFPTVYLPPEFIQELANISAMAANFEDMSQLERKEWFFDFARAFRLDHLGSILLNGEPSTDALDYLTWISLFNKNWESNDYPREYVEEMVLTYFDVVLDEFSTWEYRWVYDEKNQVYTVYPGEAGGADGVYYLLESITCEDGIYTVHASLYVYYTLSMPTLDEQEVKKDLFEGNNTKLIYRTSGIISFRLDPETNLPIFCGMESESLTG
jgi:hypothetical protein